MGGPRRSTQGGRSWPLNGEITGTGPALGLGMSLSATPVRISRPCFVKSPHAFHEIAAPPLLPCSPLEEGELYDLMGLLAARDGEQHRERWVPRTEHRTLPPFPNVWRHPPLSVSPPLSQVQLNPFLVHRKTGRPAMLVDIRLNEDGLLLGEQAGLLPSIRCPVPFCIEGPNGAQPATYPGLTSMNITAIADDALGQFPWPFVVSQHHPSLPVTMEDFLYSLLFNFRAFLKHTEIDNIPDGRRAMINQAYFRRLQCTGMPNNDGLRRSDYFGDRYQFRGLEPAPDGRGYIMFFGLP